MPDIIADGVEINIADGHWRLFNSSGSYSLTPFFRTLRGEGLIHYTATFAEARGLPGTVLSSDYVRAVIVGFDSRNSRWTLGLHVAMTEDEKPRFVELAHWPPEDNPQHATNCHTAGRILAEYLTCPLKLFGVKRAAQLGAAFNPRATVTGPALAHRRTDIDPRQVSIQAKTVDLPISIFEIWLGSVNNNVLMLRLPKEAVDKSKGEVPAYTQVAFDQNTQLIRLTPPTGLLGAFFGGQGRSIRFSEVRNVEQRHTISHESTIEHEEGDLATDVTKTTHQYDIFLTLADEAIMLVQLKHVTTSNLRRRRMRVRVPGSSDTMAAEQDMYYLRQHQRDQERFERITSFADKAAYVIADYLSRTLVKTTVGDEFE